MSDKLWDDERLEKSLRTWAATSAGRIDYTGLLRLLRDEYEAELAKLRASAEWEMVPMTSRTCDAIMGIVRREGLSVDACLMRRKEVDNE